MWEDPEEDEEEEEDGLAGQLLSDILATSKYGERLGDRAWPLHPGPGGGHGWRPGGLTLTRARGRVWQRRTTTRTTRRTTPTP